MVRLGLGREGGRKEGREATAAQNKYKGQAANTRVVWTLPSSNLVSIPRRSSLCSVTCRDNK